MSGCGYWHCSQTNTHCEHFVDIIDTHLGAQQVDSMLQLLLVNGPAVVLRPQHVSGFVEQC